MCAQRNLGAAVWQRSASLNTRNLTLATLLYRSRRSSGWRLKMHNTGSLTQQLMHTLPQLMTAVQLHSDCARQAMAIDRCCHVVMTHIKRCRGPVQSTSECQGHALKTPMLCLGPSQQAHRSADGSSKHKALTTGHNTTAVTPPMQPPLMHKAQQNACEQHASTKQAGTLHLSTAFCRCFNKTLSHALPPTPCHSLR
jgi:hypothetical protein